MKRNKTSTNNITSTSTTIETDKRELKGELLKGKLIK